MKFARILNIQCQVGSTMARMATAIGLVLALFAALSTADDNWHTQWRRVRLNAEQEAKANADLKTIIDWPGTAKSHHDDLAMEDANAERYEPLNFDDKKNGVRYGPLCRIERTKLREDTNRNPNLPPTGMSYICTCAFLTANILITAAHCFFLKDDNWGKGTNAGKATLLQPSTGWQVYVVQAYGGETKEKYVENLRKRAQVLVEWWTPEKFTGNEADVDKHRHADVAFAKVRNEPGNKLQAKRRVYDLRQPVGKLWSGKKYNMFDDSVLLIQLGYPAAYKNSEMAVQITGQITECEKTEQEFGGHMAFLGQACRGPKKESALKLLLSNKKKNKKELDACPAAPIVGNMGSGGSGGPLIVRNEDVDESDKLWMATFGVISTCEVDAENNPTRRCDAVRIESDMIEALEQISKLKLDFAAPQKTDGVAKAVATADASTEKVELQLPKAAAKAAERAAKKNNKSS